MPAALEFEVADQATCLELARLEKLELASESSGLKELLLKAEEEMAELRAENAQLNKAWDEAVESKISVQEELKYCKSARFRKNIIDNFKSSP